MKSLMNEAINFRAKKLNLYDARFEFVAIYRPVSNQKKENERQRGRENV